jgi:hypothetical protein
MEIAFNTVGAAPAKTASLVAGVKSIFLNTVTACPTRFNAPAAGCATTPDSKDGACPVICRVLRLPPQKDDPHDPYPQLIPEPVVITTPLTTTLGADPIKAAPPEGVIIFSLAITGAFPTIFNAPEFGINTRPSSNAGANPWTINAPVAVVILVSKETIGADNPPQGADPQAP